ncbi:MAG TPA: universal stress protein [Steroidobacteraceae bacterium]|nr:universal stress protein [Steroidobacteraceae bacterium]
MEKLTTIFAVVEHPDSGRGVLDKAVTLARQFDARVELLVIQPQRRTAFLPDSAALEYPHITVRAVPRAAESLPAILLREVRDRQPDLLIKAPAGAHALRRWALAANDWQLSQQCPVPLMLASAKRWANPVRLAASVDVSDPCNLDIAGSVLHAAGLLALGCHGSLDVLYTEREQEDEFIRMERAVRLAQLVREFHVGCERLQMFEGAPDKRLPPLFAARQYDLLVLGSVSHRRAPGESIRSLTSRLAESTTGDVLLVKGPPDERRHAALRASSGEEQVADQCQQLV